jgi:hypothetical protein
VISLTISRRATALRLRGRSAGAALAALGALVAAAGVPTARAGAQILRVPKQRSEPAYWAGVGVGYYQMNAVADGRTGTGWDFGSGAQYRGTLEYSLGRGSSIGVTGTYARLPLRYVSLTDSPLPGGAFEEDAHAQVTQLLGTFHAGGGEGFHYVIDAGLGVTRFANFESDATGATLLPSSDTDLAFSIGTGFGYSSGKSAEFFLVQDYGNTIHQRDGLSNNARTNIQQLTTRIGARFGTGTRRSR